MLAQLQKAKVGVIGGGLAGLATAAALCAEGLRVELFEARQQLGGRAGSFRDPTTEQLVDHCQHVGMGCCTNFLHFCQQTGIEDLLRHDSVLHFVGPDGRRCDLRASRWLPAPLHLAPSLMGLRFLSWGQRFSIARTLLRLGRSRPGPSPSGQTIGQWLQHQGQSDQSMRRFWSVVLVSALGESIDRASLAAARKVFVDGFMSHRQAYQVAIPKVPLTHLYDRGVAQWLRRHGALIHCGQPVQQLEMSSGRIQQLKLSGGECRQFDFYVVALAWRRVQDVLPAAAVSRIRGLPTSREIPSSPITGVHLWFDRPITSLPHAILVDRLSQWMFHRGQQAAAPDEPLDWHYYQVVISASRSIQGRDRESLCDEIVEDLRSVFPAARQAHLKQWRIVTQPDAVFSVVPGLDQMRPAQKTEIANLFLAGDWTDTGWPSTMEGAVRSGYLAAESLLHASGRSKRLLQADLPRGPLARLIAPADRQNSWSS